MVSVFAAVFVALWAAHQVADHWVQTPHQSSDKGLPGWRGRVACAGHVASYTATAVVVLAAVAWRLDLSLSVPRIVAGLAVSAVSHYWADRRSTLRWLVSVVERLGMPGKLDYFDHGGAYALDQSWHVGWLFIAALLIA